MEKLVFPGFMYSRVHHSLDCATRSYEPRDNRAPFDTLGALELHPIHYIYLGDRGCVLDGKTRRSGRVVRIPVKRNLLFRGLLTRLSDIRSIRFRSGGSFYDFYAVHRRACSPGGSRNGPSHNHVGEQRRTRIVRA